MLPHPDRLAKGLYWDRAWSLVSGCSKASAGCRNCWAASQAHRMAGHPNPKIAAHNAGLTWADGGWNGVVRTRPDLLDLPLRTRKPTVWAVWTDLFHEAVPDAFRLQAFDVMRRCASERPEHVFLVLTKRAMAMRRFSADLYFWGGTPTEHSSGLLTLGKEHPRQHLLLPLLTNTWLGVTVEGPEQEQRLYDLADTPAAHRWVSAEPLLAPISLRWGGWITYPTRPDGSSNHLDGLRRFDWVVCGGENAPEGDFAPPEAVAALRDQCAAAGVPFFFKGWGGPRSSHLGRTVDGREHLEVPWQTE